MTTFGFIRHGNTDWNIEKRVQGQADVPLNETGRRQAQALAARLAGETWDALISSDLSRARETAEIVGRTLGHQVRTDARLREQGYGQLEGLLEQECVDTWGTSWALTGPEVESRDDVLARGMAAVEELAVEFPDSRILVVSHGDTLCGLFNYMLGRQELAALHNTSFSLIGYDNKKWRVDLLNCNSHLIGEPGR
ncbi:MAG: histidine phosphatase family protein [Paenibacillaceae bacterium]|nr:histidine phosphatase family protein [Paenibacillaceae bacterium]